MIEVLCGLMAPITSFLADEVHGFLPAASGSIFEKGFPEPDAAYEDRNLMADFEILLEIRSLVSKDLEELRRQKVIGSSLDAGVKLTIPEEKAKVLDRYRPYLREFLIVSQISYQTGAKLEVTAGKAEGEKCARCWYYSPLTGKDPRFPGVCEKCVEALS
jgi:isoleucyl-tRNA synthetase